MSGARVRLALLSNPYSTGNRSQLPRIRAFCDARPDIFHYEVEEVGQIGAAMCAIAKIRPQLLVINGGDGTVQAALTELVNGGQFGGSPPPVAVLPNGKTNLIALDLGAQGDPVVALERLAGMAAGDLSGHVVRRRLIALSRDGVSRPVVGMFVGGAGLADTMLFCREKIYPLGLPNGLSHLLTAFALIFRQLSGIRSRFLPPGPRSVRIGLAKRRAYSGQFSFLAVTTLDRLLLGSKLRSGGGPGFTLLTVDHRATSLLRGLFAGLTRRLGRQSVAGVRVEEVEEVSIEGEGSSVILDGELFESAPGHPIRLTPAPSLPFVRLAA